MSVLFRLKKWLGKQAAPSKPLPSAPAAESSAEPGGNEPAVTDIQNRLEWFKQNLKHCSDVVYHTFVAGPDLDCAVIFLKGMIDRRTIQENVVQVVMSFGSELSASEFSAHIFERGKLPVGKQDIRLSLKKGLRSILRGETLLIVDGEARMIAIAVSTYEKRAVEEAKNETVIRGPREAFVEDLDTNVTLLRRRLKTAAFKIDMMHIGSKTDTAVAISYIHGICKQSLIDEVRRRLSQIDIDGVLGSSYLEESIEDTPYTPFPQMQYTERPDIVCAALLEGRVAVLVDGTPIAILAPVTLFMLMQSAEDYYQRYVAASWIRMMRFFFLFVSLLLPGFYIAATTFHPDMIPERLLLNVASSSEVVPFPALVEALIMELSFEGLREAAVRIPKVIGQAISIIGALIIGTAAVEAGIASPAMVIIVSLTGIASFMIPHIDLGFAFRLLRFPIMVMAGIFGLFGIGCGVILIYLHLLELRSFGFPYLTPVAPLQPNDLKDTLARAPWWTMRKRPSFLSSDHVRQSKASRKWVQSVAEEE